MWQTPLTIGLGDRAISKSLHLWINDGLMAIFFLVVGLEIKREVLVRPGTLPEGASDEETANEPRTHGRRSRRDGHTVHQP